MFIENLLKITGIVVMVLIVFLAFGDIRKFVDVVRDAIKPPEE